MTCFLSAFFSVVRENSLCSLRLDAWTNLVVLWYFADQNRWKATSFTPHVVQVNFVNHFFLYHPKLAHQILAPKVYWLSIILIFSSSFFSMNYLLTKSYHFSKPLFILLPIISFVFCKIYKIADVQRKSIIWHSLSYNETVVFSISIFCLFVISFE